MEFDNSTILAVNKTMTSRLADQEDKFEERHCANKFTFDINEDDNVEDNIDEP